MNARESTLMQWHGSIISRSLRSISSAALAPAAKNEATQNAVQQTAAGPCTGSQPAKKRENST